MYNPHPLYDILSARKDSNDVIIYESTGTELIGISYSELNKDVLSWAGYFAAHGIKPGDRVVSISTKCANHFRFFFACWRLGAIAVPVCETQSVSEISFVIQDCSPALVLAGKDFFSKAQASAGDIPVVDWDTIPKENDISELPPSPTDVELVAALIYTSGSTGMPKGVMLTHKNLWVNCKSNLDMYSINSKDKLLSLLPYWHAFALSCELLCGTSSGCSIFMPKDIRDFKRNLGNLFKPTIVFVVPRIIDGLVATIKKGIKDMPEKKRAFVEKAIYNASRIFTAGPCLKGGMLRMLTHHCLYDPLVFRKIRAKFGGQIRVIVSGGAPLDLEYQIFFKYLGIPLFQGYGLSETSPVVCVNAFEYHKLGSCGRVMPWLLPENGGDYTFKDEDGVLSKDRPGQLLLKGDCVMKGYWNHADASAKTFEEGGWINTGDVGHVDKEGYIFIHGRKGNMIVLGGGEKLHPEHIEDAIKNSEYITEAMVIGEKCKNVYALVNVNHFAQEKHTAEELHALIKNDVIEKTKDIVGYQKPKNVLILPDFTIENGTLTATMKIRRHKIMELYRKEIEDFLVANGEEIATKHQMELASSRVVESLEEGTVIVGDGNVIK